MNTEIKKLSDENLIKEVKRVVGEERLLTAELLHYLCEVQRRRLFALYGYPSLFMFCIKFLGYTESQTQRRIEAMRAMTEIPEIEEKIKAGALSLTAVAQAQSYFKSQEKENKPISLEAKKEVLLSLENKSTRECEKELIKLSGEKPLPKEKTKLISEDFTQVTLNLPNEVIEKLERIKSLLSNKNPNMSKSELINEMAEIVLDEIDPVRKEQRKEKSERKVKVESKSQRDVYSARMVTLEKETEISSFEVSKIGSQKDSQGDSGILAKTSPKISPKTPAKISPKREVTIRDQGRCSYISPITHGRCNSTFQLELDHILPRAMGGETTADNMRLFCKAHNQRAAIDVFGLEKMDRHIN